jgi:AcrR family transcriptional regulator
MSGKQFRPRGPSQHARRDQIVTAAHEHFRQYGYEKTTVGNVAKAVGISTAYFYKFFDSKQAIGNAICSLCLEEIERDVTSIIDLPVAAEARIRRLFMALSAHAGRLSFRESRFGELISYAWQERWQAVEEYEKTLANLITLLVDRGRRTGEFEHKTTLDETCRSILISLEPLRNPALWMQRLGELDEQANSLASLVLRSLAP